MKHLLFYALLIISTPLFSQYRSTDKGSKIEFRVKNLGFTVSGRFSGLSGTILFDLQNLSSSNIAVSVDASSVNTDNSMRDDHLRGESYFDVTKYPRIYFVSTRITPANKGGFLASGKLTMKNVSREIAFPFLAKAVNGGYEFKGSFTINRRDFDVGGLSIISDMLTVDLDVLTNK